MDMLPQSLTTYLNGKSKPSTGMKHKLQSLGADIQYIMTGIKSPPVQPVAVRVVGGGEDSVLLARLLEEMVKSNMLMEARMQRLETTVDGYGTDNYTNDNFEGNNGQTQN